MTFFKVCIFKAFWVYQESFQAQQTKLIKAVDGICFLVTSQDCFAHFVHKNLQFYTLILSTVLKLHPMQELEPKATVPPFPFLIVRPLLWTLITLSSFYINLSILPSFVFKSIRSNDAGFKMLLRNAPDDPALQNCTMLLQCFTESRECLFLAPPSGFPTVFLHSFCWYSVGTDLSLQDGDSNSGHLHLVLDKCQRQTRVVHLDGFAYICWRKKNMCHQ